MQTRLGRDVDEPQHRGMAGLIRGDPQPAAQATEQHGQHEEHQERLDDDSTEKEADGLAHVRTVVPDQSFSAVDRLDRST